MRPERDRPVKKPLRHPDDGGNSMPHFRNTRAAGFWVVLVSLAGTAQAKPNIVGGRSISITEAPYQLMFETHEGNATGLCGAVWIGARWVLTAAHCVENATPENASIYAGITRHKEATAANAIPVARIIANSEFPKTWKDIAVMELAKDITSPLAKPIAWATAADSKAGLTSPGKLVVATGWGGINKDGKLADSLQMLRTAVADTEKYVISMVPKGTTADAGSCGGDSGGPFVVRDAAGTGWIVAGLSSFITSFCGDRNSPSSYTRVSVFGDWIRQQTGMVTGGIDPRGIIAPLKHASLFTAPGRFHLDHAQTLELQVVDPAGAVLFASRGAYAAGEHAFPAASEAAGARILRLVGAGTQETQMLPWKGALK